MELILIFLNIFGVFFAFIGARMMHDSSPKNTDLYDIKNMDIDGGSYIETPEEKAKEQKEQQLARNGDQKVKYGYLLSRAGMALVFISAVLLFYVSVK